MPAGHDTIPLFFVRQLVVMLRVRVCEWMCVRRTVGRQVYSLYYFHFVLFFSSCDFVCNFCCLFFLRESLLVNVRTIILCFFLSMRDRQTIQKSTPFLLLISSRCPHIFLLLTIELKPPPLNLLTQPRTSTHNFTHNSLSTYTSREGRENGRRGGGHKAFCVFFTEKATEKRKKIRQKPKMGMLQKYHPHTHPRPTDTDLSTLDRNIRRTLVKARYGCWRKCPGQSTYVIKVSYNAQQHMV